MSHLPFPVPIEFFRRECSVVLSGKSPFGSLDALFRHLSPEDVLVALPPDNWAVVRERRGSLRARMEEWAAGALVSAGVSSPDEEGARLSGTGSLAETVQYFLEDRLTWARYHAPAEAFGAAAFVRFLSGQLLSAHGLRLPTSGLPREVHEALLLLEVQGS